MQFNSKNLILNTKFHITFIRNYNIKIFLNIPKTDCCININIGKK